MRKACVAVLGAAVWSGCVVPSPDWYPCDNPDQNHWVNNTPDPCYYIEPRPDAGIAIEAGATLAACPGECIPGVPYGWGPPTLVWIGTEAQAPACPEQAPFVGFEGHADPNLPPPACGACSCEPPAGTCGLPATIKANNTTCPPPGAGVTLTPFDPPPRWDGACSSFDAVMANQTCGSGLCVRSLSIGPLRVEESPCAPVTASAPPVPPPWRTFARACSGTGAPPACEGNDGVCAPSPPAGFQQCIFHEGDVACPANPETAYSIKQGVFGGLNDTRACTPCACGASEGSQCSGTISIFLDAVCAVPLLTHPVVSDTMAACLDLPPGSALGSKSMGPTTYTLGTCPASGGQAVGSAAPTGPVTFCCLGVTPPPPK